MKLTSFILLLVVVTGAFVSGENFPPEPPITTSTDVPTSPNITTSVPPTTSPNSTTSLPPTTSPNTTTSVPPTTSPNTTTSVPPTTSPNTTTSVPPTTSPNTTTSVPPTTSPNTTTSVPPTTSPQPTPPPNSTTTIAPPSSTPVPPQPKTGNWTVKDKNVTCIVADMTLLLNITLRMDENKSVIVEVPASANATGSCGNATQTLILQWGKPNMTAKIEISFQKNESAKVFSMSQVNVTLPYGFVPEANASLVFFENKEDFSTPLSKSYKCAKVQQLQLTHSDNSTTAVLKISHVQFEAFREKKDVSFGSAEDCESSNSSTDVVPIAVGCVLVGLVIIVLVAYLVGRRRSQSRGYLSM